MTQLLEGGAVAASIEEKTAEKIQEIKNKGIFPALAIVRVGENQRDISYERGAFKRAFEMGIMARPFVFEESITQEELIEEIKKLNEDKFINGVLIFRPLPEHINDKAVCDALDPAKDVDGITQGSMAGIFTGSGEGYPPCTAEACMQVMKHYGIELEGKKVTVFGRSLVVGKPAAMMAMDENATVTICHSRTAKDDFDAAGKNADIVIAALGKARMLKSDNLGKNQVIIDVGINVDENDKLCGDVDFDDVSASAAAITPVPGGIGSVTTAVLMKHVAEAAEKSIDGVWEALSV